MYMLRKFKNKIEWWIRGGYNPRLFWDEWAKTFMDDKWQVDIHPQHEWLLTEIIKSNPKSILEIGCGFGRNIRYLVENGVTAEISGIDISPKMIKKAKEYTKNYRPKLYNMPAEKMTFKNKTFDVSFSHGVLMHVPTSNIESVLKELIRVTKKKIIMIEQNYGGNEYTFIHDYKKILKDLGLARYSVRRSKNLGLDMISVEL